MHEGLLELEKRGTDEDRRAVAALRKIEEILGAARLKPMIAVFENRSYEHSTDNLILDLELRWLYNQAEKAVVCSLEFRDNPEQDVACSIYIRLNLLSDKWQLGYRRRNECEHVSSHTRKVAWKVFKFVNAPAEFEIPAQDIFSKILPAMIRVFKEWAFDF